MVSGTKSSSPSRLIIFNARTKLSSSHTVAIECKRCTTASHGRLCSCVGDKLSRTMILVYTVLGFTLSSGLPRVELLHVVTILEGAWTTGDAPREAGTGEAGIGAAGDWTRYDATFSASDERSRSSITFMGVAVPAERVESGGADRRTWAVDCAGMAAGAGAEDRGPADVTIVAVLCVGVLGAGGAVGVLFPLDAWEWVGFPLIVVGEKTLMMGPVGVRTDEGDP